MTGPLLKNLRITPSEITKRDRQCWSRRGAGQSDEQISLDLNIDIALVDKHCKRFESARAAASSSAVDMATNIEAMIAVEGVGQDLRDARSAQRFTGYYDHLGNPIFERDWTTALDAVDKLGSLISKSRSKEGGAGVNIAIQNNTLNNNGNGNGAGQVRSFEALVREAEKRRRLELGEGTVAAGELKSGNGETEDAEYEEVDDAVDNGADESNMDDAALDNPDELDDED